MMDSDEDMTKALDGLKELEKLINESNDYELNQSNSLSLNGNKLLNELLDKPISDENNDESKEESIANNDSEADDEDEDEDNDNNSKGIKRSIGEVDDDLVDDNFDNKIINNNESKPKIKSKTKVKKKTNPQLRKNIKNIFNENELDRDTLEARKQEEERMARQRERFKEIQMQSQINSNINLSASHSRDINSHFQRFSDIQDEVLVLSSDEEESNQHNSSLNQLMTNFGTGAEIIDLSSGDEGSPSINFRPQSSHYTSDFGYDYNNRSYEDEISIIDNVMSLNPEENYEDLNNCGSHTDDSLNIPDSDGNILVNVAHPPEDTDIYLPPQICRSVKPHQIGGIRFLYDNVIESINQFENSSGFGCILSHSMGLGKTMQTIAFIDVFLTHTKAKHVLCIVPINTLQNWLGEFNIWLPEKGNILSYLKKDNNTSDIKYRTFKIFALNEAKSTTARAKEILSWRKYGGVLLLGYEMYRILTSNNKKKSTKDDDIDPKVYDEINQQIQASLINPGPDLVVCDEGHRIKNCNAATSLALKNIKTKRRIVLTGYPLQNNLIEYWCMVDFVRPNYLGLKPEFTNMFERPIVNGQCSDSNAQDRKLMRYRAHVLYQLLKGFVQRRSHTVLQRALPAKDEFVIMCRMSSIQKKLMLAFLDTAINDPTAIGNSSGRMSTLLLFSVCCKIWNHPDIVYDIFRKGISTDDLDIEIPSKNKKLTKNTKKKHKNEPTINESSVSQQPTASQLPEELNLFSTPLRSKNEGIIDYSWSEHLLRNYTPGNIEHSNKMIILFEIIEETISSGDRLLLFSQSLFTLDLIERFLQSRNVPNTKSKWVKYQTYYRLDGSTPTHEREKYINQFNNKNNAHLFLISTRAGSLGINLIGANRIVIFDASWNPCHDAQAACRIYRYGQTKPCFIYRLICDNSLEKKIYDRQVNKQGMANRVVDEQNVETQFTWREIHSLLDDLQDIREEPIRAFNELDLSKFSDTLIKHLLIKLNHCISRLPFQHESLLLDRKETKLTKEEKKIAETQYQMAKKAKDDFGISFSTARSQMASRYTSNHMSSGFYLPNPSLLPSQMTPTPRFYDGFSQYPDVSQPLPPYPPLPRPPASYNFSNFDSIAETLVKNGHSVKKMRVPNDLSISISPNKAITIKKGEEVMVIKTQKGLYLKTNEGNIISIKGNNDYFTGEPLPSFIPVSNNDSFGIIQPALHCGGTVHLASNSRASSTVSHPPEVVQLSDDDSRDSIRAEDTNNYMNTNPTLLTNGSVHTLDNNYSHHVSQSDHNQTLHLDTTQSISSLSESNLIEDPINMSFSESDTHSLQTDPMFSTPNTKSLADFSGFETSTAENDSFDSLSLSMSQSMPSNQLNGSSIESSIDV